MGGRYGWGACMTVIHFLTLAPWRALRQWLLPLLLLISCASLAQDEPERSSGWQQKQAVSGQRQAVVTASPWASRVAWAVLERGGSALDAAVAAQWLLTLVEPQSSGLGGGAFLLYYDAKAQRLLSYDGRETAPAAVDVAALVQGSQSSDSWWSLVASGDAVGVPGVVAMLAAAHEAHGRLSWPSLAAPAIALAERGVASGQRLPLLITELGHPALQRPGQARDYFYPEGQPLRAGQSLRNPELAAALRQIAATGAAGFYRGPLAQQMVVAVQGAGGSLSLADLAAYQPRQRQPLCLDWRQYRVCSMGPPSGGGLALLQLLAMWQALPPLSQPLLSVAGAHRFSQLSRLVFADRDAHVADPDFQPVPVAQLLSPVYLKRQLARVAATDSGPVASGLPAPGDGQAPELPSTSHLSIIDADGNVASMTSSIEMGFGSGLMAGGFLLNNQLTDFALSGDLERAANRPAPGKRPRSSMMPTVVFDRQGRVRLVIGSPGGSRIIPYVAWALIAYLEQGMSLQQALDLGHVVNLNQQHTELEAGTSAAALAPGLRALGHQLVIRPLDSGLHAIAIEQGRLVAAADGRREGLALAR